MIEHKIDIHNREITNPIFIAIYPDNIDLNMIILSYFDGNKWKIIPRDLLIANPIIYDKYHDLDGSINDISIIYCPFSSVTGIFFGKYTLSKYILNNIILCKDKNDNIFSPLDGTYMNQEHQKPIRRTECSIKTFRDALIQHQDFLLCISSKTKPNMISENYFTDNNLFFPTENNNDDNKYHNKTLVYLLQYNAIKKDRKKCFILINKNANRENISGYDIVRNGITKYISSVEDKIRTRFGIITPMYWIIAKHICKNARIVHIDN